MNRKRFIERLNLFLDGELPSGEVEELLSAARRDPEYGRIYRQYCQINKACVQLGEAFAPAGVSRSQWRQRIYAMGGMAAAVALLALAAQNVAPLIVQDESPVFAVNSAARPAPQTLASAVQPASTSTLDSDRQLRSRLDLDAMEVRSVDLDQAFGTRGSDGLFAPPRLSVASFSVNQQEADVESKWKPTFALGQAVNAPTFEHVLVSSSDSFKASARPSAVYEPVSSKGSDLNSLRFDLTRLRAVSSQAMEAQAGATMAAER